MKSVLSAPWQRYSERDKRTTVAPPCECK